MGNRRLDAPPKLQAIGSLHRCKKKKCYIYTRLSETELSVDVVGTEFVPRTIHYGINVEKQK